MAALVFGSREETYVNQTRKVVLIVVAALAASAFLVANALPAPHGSPPQPERVDLATAMPSFAPGYRLSLTREILPAGASFAPHRHPGMQVAYITAGTLHFTVFRGIVKVYRGKADSSQTVVRSISAGETGLIRPGEWIVETPGVWHQGANDGTRRVVILVATLLRAKEPAAIPVKP
jgi:quercetin dioxygenase-like cupin family protein